MNVQSAEKLTNKLLDYVQALKSDSPTMYKKSQQRLTNIALTCNQIVSLISEILEQEILASSEEQEFTSNTGTNIFQSITSMETSLAQLRRFISYIPDAAINDSIRCLVLQYRDLFASMRVHSDNSVARIANLLVWWIDKRFLSDQVAFTCQSMDIPYWIQNIIIVYAYYMERHQETKFTSKFLFWCDNIDPANIQGVPYDIGIFDKDSTAYSKYLTLSALILWDKLLQNGLSTLCTLVSTDGYPSEDGIFILCESYTPNLLEKYDEQIRGSMLD